MDWIHLAQDRGQWRALVSTALLRYAWHRIDDVTVEIHGELLWFLLYRMVYSFLNRQNIDNNCTLYSSVLSVNKFYNELFDINFLLY
jgi:hypothetical protein